LEYGAVGIPVVQLDGQARKRFGDLLVYTDSCISSIRAAVMSATNHDPKPFQSFVQQFDWRNIAQTYDRALSTVR
jgi:hypothetical protein